MPRTQFTLWLLVHVSFMYAKPTFLGVVNFWYLPVTIDGPSFTADFLRGLNAAIRWRCVFPTKKCASCKMHEREKSQWQTPISVTDFQRSITFPIWPFRPTTKSCNGVKSLESKFQRVARVTRHTKASQPCLRVLGAAIVAGHRPKRTASNHTWQNIFDGVAPQVGRP